MLSVTVKDKLKAAFIHLFVSAVLVILSYLIVTQFWYPAPFFSATGVSQIFILIVIVDLVLGPLLTFIVYRKNKETLVTDLCVIALLQISALAYGLYSVYEARPVWIVYIIDRFELVQANELIDDPAHPMTLPTMGPEYRYVDITTSSTSERLEIFTTETTYGISPIQRPKFYRDFAEAKPLIIRRSLSLEDLNQYNDRLKTEAVLQAYPNADGFLPLVASKDMTVLIDKQSGGSVVAVVDLRPWLVNDSQ